MRTLLLTLALTLLAGAASAPTARADGLPVEGVDLSRAGVPGSAAGAPRYVTLPAGRDTVVAAVSQNGGQVRRSRVLDGRFTIPAVAYDGSPGGLSADGGTLVLINPRARFPRRSTTLAVLDTRRLHARDVITLKGDFSFDAVSPYGRWLYLVQYLSKRDPTRYLVRLYDLRRGRLLPEPIIDPREVGDVMRGMPITRAASPDGRFAYTLYDDAGGHPFIHALDTVGRTARCIDLHGLMGFEDFYRLRLDVSPSGGTITILNEADPVAFVDADTNEVTDPAQLAEALPMLPEPERREATAADEPRRIPWPLVGAASALALLALAFALLRRFARAWIRRRPPEPLDVFGGVGDEVGVELGGALLDDAPRRLRGVGPEAHEQERPKALVP